MAKRFTDTGKWGKASFSEMGNEWKLVWIYLCDNCDHAGVWDVNWKLLAFHLGSNFSRAQFEEYFGDKVEFLSDTKLFIPSFIEFQYGELNEENRVHHSIISRLKKEGAFKGRASPLQGAKEQEKEKDTDKDKEKEEAREISTFDLDAKTKEIFDRVPLITRDTLTLKHSPSFLAEGLEECVSYHINDPAAAAWSGGTWGKKFTSWMIDKKRRDKGKPKTQSLDDLDLTAKEPA